MHNEIAAHWLELYGILKVAHWETRVHAQHVALDQAINVIGGHVDRLIEGMSGEERVVAARVNQINSAFPGNDLMWHLDTAIVLFDKYAKEPRLPRYAHNICDEIVAELRILLYLCTMQ